MVYLWCVETVKRKCHSSGGKLCQNPRIRKKPKWHRIGSFKYNENGNGMSPFFIGLAAEFLPADPATRFDGAVVASLRFARHEDGVIVDIENRTPALRNF
jgi:hypothetical protein